MNIEEQKNLKKPPQSYWMASTHQPEYPVLNEDIKADIAIIGGGIAGINTAYLLVMNGIRVVILEADRILQGTTGHTTAKITSQHGLIYHKTKTQISEELAKQYVDANESAITMYKKIISDNSIECDYQPQSAYVFTISDSYISKISDEVATTCSLGIKASYLVQTPLPFPVKAAVRFDDQAQFHPRKFLLPLAEIITKNGCRIFEQTRIVDIEDEEGYTLITKQGKKVSAEKVIIASHYPCYTKSGLYLARIYPERSYVIAVKAKEKFPGGMYINAEEPARSLRSHRYNSGELILVGGDHHKTGQGEDTVKHYEALIDYANQHYTIEDIPYRWSTQDCMTLDDIPYVGHYTSNTPNLYVATGYGKWGMTNSMASAILLKDLIIDGKSPWQDVYSPSRHTISASVKTFVVENLNVAKELVQGKLSPVPESAEIKPGEGKIIKVDGQKAGAYRDAQRTLHIVNTTCTHMGCELSWNSAEKSWDCPCHGSRFSYEGDILEGPAVAPLSRQNDVNTIEKVLKDNF